MVIAHKLDSDGIKFKVKVTDCLTSTAFEATDITDQFIIFEKPDGTILTKQAVLIVDSETPTESFVQYQNTSPEASILDLQGEWEYSAQITLVSTDVSQTSQAQVFWIV